jgi:glycosyltransferase involved in cell wall biosynthesis
MRILHITPTYYPATYWGGPIWSTKAICDGVAQTPDVDLRVLTTDAAGPDRSQRVTPAPLPYPVHYARRIAGHSVSPALLRQLPAAISWADVVHLTGVYNTPTLPVFALAKAMDKPVVWSPRGALQATQDWAEAPRRFAKKSFEVALNTLRPRRIVMHATAQAEVTASVHRFAGIPTKIIPNTVDIPPPAARKRTNQDDIKLIFLSRLHPKKGLTELFDAMRQLPARFSLDVYGSGDGDYTDALQLSATDLHGRVRFHGHLPDAGKAAAFAQADLFVLPSYAENFGIAVAEAMAHGVPVLTTTATPWQGLDTRGCGRCMTMGRDDLPLEIAQLADQDLLAMGARGRAWVAKDFATQSMVDAFTALYQDMAAPAKAQVFA